MKNFDFRWLRPSIRKISGYAKRNCVFLVGALIVLSYFCYFVLPSLARDLEKALPLLVFVGLIWFQTDVQNKKQIYGLRFVGREFWSVKEQLGAVLPKVEPGTQSAYFIDLFEGWDLQFITKLFYRDKSVTVLLHSKIPLSPYWLSQMDYVLAFDKEKLVIIKRPGEAFHAPAFSPGTD